MRELPILVKVNHQYEIPLKECDGGCGVMVSTLSGFCSVCREKCGRYE